MAKSRENSISSGPNTKPHQRAALLGVGRFNGTAMPLDYIQFIYQSATITAANLFAFDYENRTRKEILLSSAHPFTAGVGIVLTSVVTAVLASVPAFLLGAAAFRLRIQTSNLLVVYLAMLPVMVGCAGLVLAGASGLLLAYHAYRRELGERLAGGQ